MTRYFVSSDPVPVYEHEDGTGNVIWIRPKMDIATKGRVQNDLVGLATDGTVEFRAGANETALLVHNIVRWSGPDLDSVPCDADHIRQLDPTEPHITKVLDEIARRNKPPESGNPKSAAGNGSPSDGFAGSAAPAAASAPSANGMTPSSLPFASDGRPIRSAALTLATTTNSSHD
jgi:hypothetical protein